MSVFQEDDSPFSVQTRMYSSGRSKEIFQLGERSGTPTVIVNQNCQGLTVRVKSLRCRINKGGTGLIAFIGGQKPAWILSWNDKVRVTSTGYFLGYLQRDSSSPVQNVPLWTGEQLFFLAIFLWLAKAWCEPVLCDPNTEFRTVHDDFFILIQTFFILMQTFSPDNEDANGSVNASYMSEEKEIEPNGNLVEGESDGEEEMFPPPPLDLSSNLEDW